MTTHRDDDDRLLEAARLIADGASPDWEQLRSDSHGDTEQRILDHLRAIEAIGRVHAEMRHTEDADTTRPEDAGQETVAVPAPSPDLASGDAAAEAVRRRTWRHLQQLERVGSGAFGDVYRAWDPVLERRVALKLLRPRARDGGSQPRSAPILEEGRRLARVDHPNVIRVYGAEEHEGQIGLWMEFIDGRTLADIVETQGPFGEHEATGIVAEVCRALAAVHKEGIIHRDVNARNVMREKGGRIVLMDFGAGTTVAEDGSPQAPGIAGTPYYMAPEVLDGQPATVASDVYSLGVLLHYLLTGAHPVEAASLAELREKHRAGMRRLLREVRPEVSTALVQVADKALHPDPRQRFDSAAAMEAALQAAAGRAVPVTPGATSGTAGRRRSRVRMLVGAVVLLAVLIAGAGIQRAWRHAATPAPGTYRIGATFYRVQEDRAIPMHSGDPVALGDALFLEVEGSDSLFVYVVNRDEAGHAYVLFPLPGMQPSNPLAPGMHRLPGTLRGAPFDWQVTTLGGKESFWVFASPERLVDLEVELAALQQPADEFAAGGPPERRVRGAGGLVERTQHGIGKRTEALMREARELGSGPEVADGIWIRRAEFVSPGQSR